MSIGWFVCPSRSGPEFLGGGWSQIELIWRCVGPLNLKHALATMSAIAPHTSIWFVLTIVGGYGLAPAGAS
jgi:hypothetical protein